MTWPIRISPRVVGAPISIFEGGELIRRDARHLLTALARIRQSETVRQRDVSRLHAGDSKEDVDASWTKEIERRVHELEQGRAELLDPEDVHARVFKKHGIR